MASNCNTLTAQATDGTSCCYVTGTLLSVSSKECVPLVKSTAVISAYCATVTALGGTNCSVQCSAPFYVVSGLVIGLVALLF